jgi:hypothetical protein
VSLPPVKDADGRPDLEATLAELPTLEKHGATDALISMGGLTRDEAELPWVFEQAARAFESSP